jgi:predicted RNA-binding Zn-ribbon protein involved in translation (DUF1610 family)
MTKILTAENAQTAPHTPVAYADATAHPCPKCGDDIVVAYAGLHPRYVAVRCFEGHFLGWAPWPETQGGFNS